MVMKLLVFLVVTWAFYCLLPPQKQVWESLEQNGPTTFGCDAPLEDICRVSGLKHSIKAQALVREVCPNYFGFIHDDLSTWSSGIGRYQLDQATRRRISMHVAIIKGKLYVKMTGRCCQSRPLFTLWGLSMMLERYPGEVADVEFLISCKDHPVVRDPSIRSPMEIPPPIFSYCRNNATKDILFPDYSFWGWPEVNIAPWELESKDILAGSREIKWENRTPSAFWRGDVNMGTIRKPLLKCNSTAYGVEVHAQNWSNEVAEGYKNSKFSKQCNHRYNIYAEGMSWSASLKYRMACASTMLNIASQYYDFFSRALVAGHHYLDIPSNNNMCKALWSTVGWGNAHIKEAKEIGEHGREFVAKHLKMDHVYDYMFHLLNSYAKLQKFTPQVPRGGQPMCLQALECMASERALKVLKSNSRIQKPPCIFL